VEERCVSIISNLFYGLAAKGDRRQRLAAKFVEAEFEKCDRLLEVFFKWVAGPAPAGALLAAGWHGLR
jgi:beta-catenin-like protein 1